MQSVKRDFQPSLYAKLHSLLFGVFSKRRNLKDVKIEKYLWNNKPIIEDSVLLWDLENIHFNRLEDIKKLAKYTPQDMYVITKEHLSNKYKNRIEKEHFKILDSHKGISDEKIIAIMKLYANRPYMILISSDTDFAKSVNRYIKHNRMQWIVVEANKKGVAMRADLANSNLTISVLPQKDKKPTYTPKNKKAKKSNNTAPRSTAAINNTYGTRTELKYHFGALKRIYRGMKHKLKALFKKQTDVRVKPNNNHAQHTDQFFMDHAKFIKENQHIIPQEFIVTKRITSDRSIKVGKVIQYSKDRNALMLYKKLKNEYEMPKFKKIELFKDVEEVSHLISYDEKFKLYRLNRFERNYE
jgi:hypothetical protein